MVRHEIKGPISDDTLNKTNRNFKELFDEFGNVVETVSEKAYMQVVDSAKINWETPVNSIANLPTSDVGGVARMTRDTGKVYRYDGSNWMEIQQIDAGPVNELDTRVTQQMAETETEISKKPNRKETGWATLNSFDESTRAIIQGMDSGEINAVLGYKNVQIENIDFIEESSNLLDERELIRGFTLSGTTGEVLVNADYSITPFIAITPEVFYTMDNVGRWVIYDDNKTIITSSTGNQIKGTTDDSLGFENARFVRLSVANAEVEKNKAQLNEGEILLPYEEFYIRFSDGLGDLRNKQVTSEKVDDKAIKLNHLKFIESSTNLFNKETTRVGFSVDTTTGEPVENGDFTLSDFIEVTPLNNYILNKVSRRSEYDSNKGFIASTVKNDNAFETSIRTHYIRLVFPKNDIDTGQMNKGNTLLPYEDFSVERLSDEAKKLFGTAKSEEKEESDIANTDFYPLDFNVEYNAPEMEDVSSVNDLPLDDMKTTDIYGLFDELVTEYPHYLSRKLGVNEVTGLPVYSYHFKPTIPEKESEITKFPKMILLSGTHCEKTGVWVNYQAVKQICENWKDNEHLEDLRWNVELIVVPLVNPWGFDNDARQNSNGVDINRNFPTDWVYTDDEKTFGGTEPLSETESQYVDDLMKENKDALYLSDFHNFFSTIPNTQLMYNSAGTSFNINLGKMLVSKMTRKFKQDYPALPQDETTMFGFSERSPRGGIARQAMSYGIQGSTFEVTNRFHTDRSNSSDTIKTGVETFITWLSLVYKNNAMLDNRSNK